MSFDLIQDPATLERLCVRLSDSPWIALDTEFTRERTFYARLGLLQLATDGIAACVDPLALDLRPVLDVLYDARILKILHAGRQDLEVFYDLRGAVPQPLFDTQIAAALLGHADQIGYATLVESITGVKLPKLHTRTNWEARPLSAEQLQYARDDVTYLRDVYRSLHADLLARDRLAWLQEECATLADPALYRSDPALAYTRLSAGYVLSPQAQPLLKALAEWRERVAQSRNRPRAWIVPDATLLEIARATPQNREALKRVPQVTSAIAQTHGDEILEIVRALRHAPAATMWVEPQPPSAARQELARRMLLRVKAVAEAQNINAGTIATRRSVQALIHERAGPLTRGWRRALVGEELLALADQAGDGRRTGKST